MFSGQGSHYFQMGRPFFDQDSGFRDSMVRLDDIVRELSGHSVIEAVYSSTARKTDNFDRTLLTHPAIFMVEYSLAQSLMRAGIEPEMTLGSSMGSFAAAAVAELMDVEDALTAVIRQASTIEACCRPGGMIAVLADPVLYDEDFLKRHSALAGINFASHFVVAAIELEAIEAELRRRNVTFQRLPVSFAFHSQWIDEAQKSFESFLLSIPTRAGRLPFVCCEQAATLSALPHDYFWRIARRPMQFREAIARLEREGTYRYIDVGPAGTLATFLKYGLSSASKSTAHAILSPYGQDQKNFAALLQSVAR
jgi:bacillaene synthase trans-acting acyltransferase